MAGHEKEVEIPVVPVEKGTIKKIWMVALILAVVTGIEYLLAFTIPAAGTAKYVRIVLFILLTIVKAYFIMKEFMHLGHEKQSLQNAVIFPLAFLTWLILALIIESGSIQEELIKFWNYLPV